MAEPQSILGNGHRHRFAFCDVTYYNGNSAASPGSETWSHCYIESRPTSYTALEYPNTEAGRRDLDSALRLLESAFKLGREDAKQEIRCVLGVSP